MIGENPNWSSESELHMPLLPEDITEASARLLKDGHGTVGPVSRALIERSTVRVEEALISPVRLRRGLSGWDVFIRINGTLAIVSLVVTFVLLLFNPLGGGVLFVVALLLFGICSNIVGYTILFQARRATKKREELLRRSNEADGDLPGG